MQRRLDPSGLYHKFQAPRLHLYVELYVMGDKYDIPRLREDATEQLDCELKECNDDDTIGELLDIVERVYTSTPESNRDLRDIVRRCATARPLPKIVDSDRSSGVSWQGCHSTVWM